MAKYGFKVHSLAAERPCENRVIANSTTLYTGSIVKLEGSGAEECDDATSDKIYGLVLGFVSEQGVALGSLSSDFRSAVADGTYTSGVWGVESYAAAADNVTDKKVKAQIQLLGPGDVLLGILDDDKGTTTGSDLETGYYVDIATDERLVDESSASTSVAQLQIVGFPDNRPNLTDQDYVLVKVTESSIAQ